MPASDVMSRQDAAHLLRRTGFGGSDAELNSLTGLTREQGIAAAMGFSDGDAAPLGPDVGVPGFVNDESSWQAHTDAITWWVQRMADLANPISVPGAVPAVSVAAPIHEKMALFWHEHFSCGQDKVSNFPYMWDQVSRFRRNGLGNFEALLREVSVHPAMLIFLDNQSNVAGSEQENFARELMELYTCGVGNFTEADVIAMARAWTGHNTIGWTGSEWDGTYVYRADDHDNANKTLFGITDNWNGVQVVGGDRDTLTELVHGVKQQPTARFIARKLFRYFAHLDPSDAVVSSLADVFIGSGMEIADLMRAVLEHDEFWGASARYGLIKSPTEFVASLARRSGLPTSDMGLRWNMSPMGQTLFDPPSVAGWGSGDYWMSTVSAWGRGSFARGRRWSAAEAGLLSGLDDSSDEVAGADAIFALFGLEDVSTATRAAIENWHQRAYGQARWSTVPQGFLLGALCPEFQVY